MLILVMLLSDIHDQLKEHMLKDCITSLLATWSSWHKYHSQANPLQPLEVKYRARLGGRREIKKQLINEKNQSTK